MENVPEYFEEIERKLTSPYIASHEIKYDEKSRLWASFLANWSL
jgi:hypothetical protein